MASHRHERTAPTEEPSDNTMHVDLADQRPPRAMHCTGVDPHGTIASKGVYDELHSVQSGAETRKAAKTRQPIRVSSLEGAGTHFDGRRVGARPFALRHPASFVPLTPILTGYQKSFEQSPFKLSCPRLVIVNVTQAQDDSETEIEIDCEETDCEEQTSCRNSFKEMAYQQLSILFEY